MEATKSDRLSRYPDWARRTAACRMLRMLEDGDLQPSPNGANGQSERVTQQSIEHTMAEASKEQ